MMAGTSTDLRLYNGVAHEFVRLPGMMGATVRTVHRREHSMSELRSPK